MCSLAGHHSGEFSILITSGAARTCSSSEGERDDGDGGERERERERFRISRASAALVTETTNFREEKDHVVVLAAFYDARVPFIVTGLYY